MPLYGPDDIPLPDRPPSPFRRFRSWASALAPKIWKLLVGNQGINAIIIVVLGILTYIYTINRHEPIRPLHDSVDLTRLERRYPYGFVIFRRNNMDSRYETFDQGGNVWDIEWKELTITEAPNNTIEVKLPINVISNAAKQTQLRNLTYLQKFPKAERTSYDFFSPIHFSDDVRLYFELIDGHQRLPIYLLGYSKGPPKD